MAIIRQHSNSEEIFGSVWNPCAMLGNHKEPEDVVASSKQSRRIIGHRRRSPIIMWKIANQWKSADYYPWNRWKFIQVKNNWRSDRRKSLDIVFAKQTNYQNRQNIKTDKISKQTNKDESALTVKKSFKFTLNFVIKT